VAIAFAVVIGIEQIAEAIVEQAVIRRVIAKDEGFEEPGRMR
jgi:hypothetical protein